MNNVPSAVLEAGIVVLQYLSNQLSTELASRASTSSSSVWEQADPQVATTHSLSDTKGSSTGEPLTFTTPTPPVVIAESAADSRNDNRIPVIPLNYQKDTECQDCNRPAVCYHSGKPHCEYHRTQRCTWNNDHYIDNPESSNVFPCAHCTRDSTCRHNCQEPHCDFHAHRGCPGLQQHILQKNRLLKPKAPLRY